MSGVLDRVVQRTRGMLPAAEPRIAASTLPRADLVFGDEWQGEVLVERESRGGPAAGRRVAQAAEAEAARAEGRSAARPVVSHTETAKGRTVPHDAAGEAFPHVLVRDVQPQEAAVANEAVGERREASLPVAPVRERVVERIREDRTVEVRERVEPALWAAGADVTRVEGGAVVAAEDRPETIHEHREVFISIGTVSMEAAPQPVVRSVAAGFRPRVSLDAFLERRQEGRR